MLTERQVTIECHSSMSNDKPLSDMTKTYWLKMCPVERVYQLKS